MLFAGPAPPARAFHAGASIGCKLYIFGGHVWVREKKGLLKFGGEGLWCLDTVSLHRGHGGVARTMRYKDAAGVRRAYSGAQPGARGKALQCSLVFSAGGQPPQSQCAGAEECGPYNVSAGIHICWTSLWCGTEQECTPPCRTQSWCVDLVLLHMACTASMLQAALVCSAAIVGRRSSCMVPGCCEHAQHQACCMTPLTLSMQALD